VIAESTEDDMQGAVYVLNNIVIKYNWKIPGYKSKAMTIKLKIN
jgi:hypothetical protein